MGSGGVGSHFGAKLHRVGERVTLVARGAHLAALKRSGLAIRSAVEGDTVVRPAVVERLEGVDRADAVLFSVKSFDTEDAAPHHLGRAGRPRQQTGRAAARGFRPREFSKTIRRALWEKYLLICAVGGSTAVRREGGKDNRSMGTNDGDYV